MLETATAIMLVVGITEAIKRATKLPTRYAPLLSLIVGTGIVFLGDMPLKETIVTGIVVGLSASGLYGGVKKTIKG